MFKNDKMEGIGTFTYTNGNRYEGEFKEGKMEGKGTFINAEGKKTEGVWKNGKPLKW